VVARGLISVILYLECVVAPRAYWKGYLKLSLVSCPIALYPATSEREKISFHQINKNTGNRIRYRKVDADTRDEVESDDIIKGYQVGKGQPPSVCISNCRQERVFARQRHRRPNCPARAERASQRLRRNKRSRHLGGHSRLFRNTAQTADCLVAEAVVIEPVSSMYFAANREKYREMSAVCRFSGLHTLRTNELAAA